MKRAIRIMYNALLAVLFICLCVAAYADRYFDSHPEALQQLRDGYPLLRPIENPLELARIIGLTAVFLLVFDAGVRFYRRRKNRRQEKSTGEL